MTTQELKDFYQLKFENRLRQNADKTLRNFKWPNTRYAALTRFLYTWDNPDEIDSEMIPILKDILLGVTEEDYSDAHDIYVEITPERTYFNCEKEEENFDLPTQDYYDILVFWRDFLREQPLDGSQNPGTIS